MPDLIITCEQCTTQFQLDDSRIPDVGVRVRCSRCKHAFFVKPERAAGHSVESVVEQALDAQGPPQGLGAPEQGLDASEPSSASLNSPSPLDEALDESDWEFNEDAPAELAPEPGLSTARDVVDDLLGATPLPEFPAPEPEPMTPEPVEEPPVEAAPEPQAEAPAEAENDQLGSPENWDFLADDEPEPAPPGVALARIQLVTGPTERPPIDVEVEPSPTAVWLGRVWQTVGWSAVVVLGLVGLHNTLVSPAPQALVPEALAVGGLEAAQVEGHWLDNAAAGPVFVVSGELRNLKPAVTVPGVRFAVRLLDASGAVVAEEAAALGPALPERRLREENPRELRALQAEASLAQAWSPMGPGSVRPFHALLEEIPAAATRFDVAPIAVEKPAPVPDALTEPGDAAEAEAP